MSSRKPTAKLRAHHKVKKSLIDVFVPHKNNDFHPHLIRPIGLVLLLSFVTGAVWFNNIEEVGDVKGAATSFSRQALLSESNEVRKLNNVPSLQLSDSLNSAAGLKARDMLVRQYWDHDAPDGTTPWFWFREVNYRYDFAGENLAKGFETPGGVVTAWMNSEEHRKNALSKDYQEVGFGVADGTLNGEETTIIVAMYGSQLGAPALSDAEVLAASDGNLSVISRFGIGLQSLNPIILGSLCLLFLTMIVALVAHMYRKRIPLNVRKGWRRHSALYKSISMAALILLLITLYGGGQIL